MIETLSEEALICCLSFLDAKDLCRFSCCTTSLKKIIHDDPATQVLWMKLCWWKIRPVSHNFRDEYKQRTQLDGEMYRYVRNNADDLPRAYFYAENGENAELWRQQIQRIDSLFDTALCLEAMKDRQQREWGLAPRNGFRIVYETFLLQQFRLALDPNLPPTLAVERCVGNISKILYVESDDNLVDIYNIDTTVSRELDHLSDILRERLQPGCTDAEAALELLNTLQIVGYEGNREGYYHVENSSIFHVLENKKGNPISLTILCHLILSRLDIETHIIGGLPGHVLLGLSGGDRFVDPFSLGHQLEHRLLGVDDCRAIASSIFVPWDDEFLRPTTPQSVLNRILNNIFNCDQSIRRFKFCRSHLLTEIRRLIVR